MRKWIIMACLAIMPELGYSGESALSGVVDAVTSDTTAKDTSNCLNLYKPYKIVIPPGIDTLVERESLQDFADFLDAQVDEIYARVRGAVCDKLANDVTVPCMVRADTIHACTYPSYCVGDDPDDANNSVISLNAAIIQLIHDGYEPGCFPDSTHLATPYLRFMGPSGDTLDFGWVGYLGDASFNHSLHYFPDDGRGGYSQWILNSDVGSSTPGNPTVGLDNDQSIGDGTFAVVPYTGMTQYGLVNPVNTSMTRDTVIFATTWTNNHGGRDTTGGPVGQPTSLAFLGRGTKYHDADAYVVDVNWGVGGGAYFGDSLWIESQTDSSFVVGIAWSATSRKLNWVTNGRRKVPTGWTVP